MRTKTIAIMSYIWPDIKHIKLDFWYHIWHNFHITIIIIIIITFSIIIISILSIIITKVIICFLSLPADKIKDDEPNLPML